jgi:hypothetical protein
LAICLLLHHNSRAERRQFANARRIPIIGLFVSISVLFGESVRFFLEAIMDNVRFPNAHTMLAVNLLSAIFLGGNDDCREDMIGVLCVTQPPRAVM